MRIAGRRGGTHRARPREPFPGPGPMSIRGACLAGSIMILSQADGTPEIVVGVWVWPCRFHRRNNGKADRNDRNQPATPT